MIYLYIKVSMIYLCITVSMIYLCDIFLYHSEYDIFAGLRLFLSVPHEQMMTFRGGA